MNVDDNRHADYYTTTNLSENDVILFHRDPEQTLGGYGILFTYKDRKYIIRKEGIKEVDTDKYYVWKHKSGPVTFCKNTKDLQKGLNLAFFMDLFMSENFRDLKQIAKDFFNVDAIPLSQLVPSEEMTIDDVEALVGHKVKIVSRKGSK